MTRLMCVVVNDEEQFSIWPVDRPLPSGWHEEGTTGERELCLAHIESIWTDMRPASLRARLGNGAPMLRHGDDRVDRESE